MVARSGSRRKNRRPASAKALVVRDDADDAAPPAGRVTKDVRRRQLLDVAAQILTAQGVEQVQITEVAERAGVSRPLVYRLFPTRQTLVEALLQDFATRLGERFHAALLATLQPLEQPLDISGHKPYVIMIAGVNGAGKTTSIGKLAKYFQNQGKSVLLAAGDTFRAAAREQLETWGERNNVTVIAQDKGDPAAVVFDAISAAKARGIDIVLADTAGRLPTQLHLMEEIAKVRRVIQKIEPSGPHETLLVLDANIGQNALQQVKAFDKAINVTGLVLTKLDGTAKGGVVTAIARQCPKPIRFIGVGEQIDDLRPFSAKDFVDALFE